MRHHRHPHHEQHRQPISGSGFGIHAITGVVAIVLMLVHALWATFTYKRGSSRHVAASTPSAPWYAGVARAYIIGMLVGIPAIHLQAVCAIGTSVIIVAILAVILFAKGRKKNDRGGKSRGTSPTRFRISDRSEDRTASRPYRMRIPQPWATCENAKLAPFGG